MKLSLENCIELVTGKGTWHTRNCGGKVPSIHLSDGPHGLRKQAEGVLQNNKSEVSTCFPTAAAAACSWDPRITASIGEAIGKEAFNAQVSVLLGPGINIKRSPLCGRNFEYFSEDPYLAGQLGSSYVQSLQGTGVAACLKHFAANSQETHRQTADSRIDSRALREIYLSAFETVIKTAKPASVMAAYNKLNGTYACESRSLLTDILRREWGFDGAVISDWGACTNLTRALQAGMDLEMPDSRGIHKKLLRRDLAAGKIDPAAIETAAHRVAKLADTYAVEHRKRQKPYDIAHHHSLSVQCAEESAVLLQNDGILPLKIRQSVAVIGALAKEMRIQGGGSSHIHTRPLQTAVEALEAAGLEVHFAPGYTANAAQPNQALEQAALDLAQQHQTVLFFGGLTEHFEGECNDRKTLQMPKNQLALVKKIAAINPNIVFVSFSGAPYDMAFAPRVRAILHLYLTAKCAAEACAHLLTGQCCPCGKLAESFPYTVEDTPCHGQFATGSDRVSYRESLYVGYRYYDKFHVPVRFAFGHGLSYTTFAYNDPKISSSVYRGGDLAVTCTVTNTGTCAGAEVVQLYVQNPTCNALRPEKELRAFCKVRLQPGESRTVTLHLNERSFSVYDPVQKAFCMPGGDYTLCLAAAGDAIRLTLPVTVESDYTLPDQRLSLAPYFDLSAKLRTVDHKTFCALYGAEFPEDAATPPGEYTTANSLAQLAAYSGAARRVLALVRQLAYLLFPGKSHNDPEVMMLLEGIQDGTLDSVVCQSGGLVPYSLAKALVKSANKGSKQAEKLHK